MPSSRHVRMTRTAISPRLAMRIFSSTLGLSSGTWAFTIARAVWCVPCGQGSGRSAGSTEIDSTNTYLLDQARQGAAEGLVAVADHQTRRAGPARPALGVAAGREPAGLGPAAPGAARPTTCTCARRPWRWRRPTPAREVAGRRGRCSSGRTTCWWAAPKLAGVLAEAEFAGGRLRGGRGRDRAQRGLAGPAGRRRHLPGRRRRTAQPVDRTVLLDRMLGRAGRAGGRCSTTRRGGAAWPTRCRAPLRHPRPGGPGRPRRARSSPGGPSAIDDAGHLVVETAAGQRTVTRRRRGPPATE